MDYKDIGDNLTVNEFNGIISLLRDNVNFNEDIQINTSTVDGTYGNYTFDFNEATVLDNGILITNETLTTVGTVKLVNPVFPNSNYYLDLKVYSSEDIGISGLEESNVIITPLTIKLENGVEVNIPFETLEMNNLIGFDAKIRIDHKDLVMEAPAYITLNSDFVHIYPNASINVTAQYFDKNDVPIESETINFYEGETLLGSVVTDSLGIASLNCSFADVGTHNIVASSKNVSSNTITIMIDYNGDMSLTFVGNSISTNPNVNFISFNGEKVGVSWDDGDVGWYSSGRLAHNYSSTGSYNIGFYGDITHLNNQSLYEVNLTKVILPNSLISIGRSAFNDCSNLNEIILPNSLISIGDSAFGRCSSLQSLDIPSSVQSINSYCFISSGLKVIYLNWENNEDIIMYKSNWIMYCSSFSHFIIPEGTTSLYIAKGYPSDKLKEGVDFDGITLTSDKNIISAYDQESATLTAQLTYEDSPVAVSGETITFEVRKQSDDSLVETLTGTTNSSGVATVSYLGKGTGDLNIKCFSSNPIIVSKTYDIVDAKWYNDGSTVNGLTSQTNVSTTSDGEWITITTSTSGEKYVLAPVNVSSSDNWEMSLKIKLTNSQNCAFNLLNENSFSLFNNVYMNITGSMFYFRLDGGTAQQISRTFQDNDKITIRRQNGSWIILHNDEQVYTKSYSWSGTKTIGWYTNQNRIQTMKEIIIKPL